MKMLVIGGAAAALFVGVVPALAQVAPPPGVAPGTAAPRVMAGPHGRPITRDEVVRRGRDMFARLDSNHDGFITRPEADAARAQMAAQMPRRAQDPSHSRAFDRIDTNRDGSISRAEFAAMPRGQGKAGRFAGMHRGGMGGHMFEMADLNKDGRVSMPEAEQAALQRFDRMDVNRDGTVTPDERRQSHQLMRAQRRPA